MKKLLLTISLMFLALPLILAIAPVAAMAQVDTNAPPTVVNSGPLDWMPLVNALPGSWQKFVLILAALSPFVARGLYSLRNGGGIKGIFSSIWLGTNTPKPDSGGDGTGPSSPRLGLWLLIGTLFFGGVAPVCFTGCSLLGSGQRTVEAKKFDSYKEVYAACRETYKTFKRECFAGHVSARREADGDRAWNDFRAAYEAAFRVGMDDLAAPENVLALKAALLKIILNP